MNLVDHSIELIESDDIYKKIEWAGRVCYKSENRIEEGSYEKFIKQIILRSGHYSVLEHSDIIIQTSASKEIEEAVPQYLKTHFYFSGETVYANVRAWRELLEYYYMFDPMIREFPILFGDLEVFTKKDSDVYFAVLHNSFKSIADFIHGKRETFLVTTTRDISHQIVRHRLLSISQESQRFCNYSKNKHNNSIKFIAPSFIKENSDLLSRWKYNRKKEEEEYFYYLDNYPPEKARNCLPNCVATDLVLTANLWEWKHIFDLRCARDAQSEIRDLMNSAKDQLLRKYRYTKIEGFLLS